MPKKNAELRFRTLRDVKEELDSLAEQYEMKRSEVYEMILNLGLTTIRNATFEGRPIKITRLTNSSCLRLKFEKEGVLHEK